MRWLEGITDSMHMSLSQLWKTARDRKPGVLRSVGSQSLDRTERLNNSCVLLLRESLI